MFKPKGRIMHHEWKPLVGCFVAVACGAGLLKNWLVVCGVDVEVVMVGNLVLFAMGLLTYFRYRRAMKQASPHGFVRQVSGIFMLKFVVLAIASLAYFFLAQPINKPAVAICAGLYLVYNYLTTAQVVRRKKVPLPTEQNSTTTI
jgi:hypothetical protein